MRRNISDGVPWESIVGYSRAVRVGDVLEISGTTAMDGDRLMCRGDIAGQTRFILGKIENILRAEGMEMRHVVRTRIFVTDISRWQEVARAHSEFFSDIRPATTMVEISKLINPDLLIEIETTAIFCQ